MGFFDDKKSSAMADEGRVEAIAKVTGKGKYSAEYRVPGVCYGVLVESAIPSGTVTAINTANARQSTGVIEIISHLNREAVPGFEDATKIKDSRFGYPIFHSDKIYFKGQPIAMVIADTFENATYAASLVSAQYSKDAFNVDFEKTHPSVPLAITGKERGSLEAWKNDTTVEAEYTIKNEVHNPMEMHATIAEWTSANTLKLYDKSQGVNNVQRVIAKMYNIPADNIQVISEFVGGGFGSALRVWPHALATIMGAKQIKRPLKVVLTRPQMFTLVGYRPESWQKIKLGATKEGKFTGLLHFAKNTTSVHENFNEGITRITRLIYNFENLRTETATVPLNLGTPTWMRGPGDTTGDFAIESAIDELSYQLNMDPVAIRLRNIAKEKDPENGKPWSTNFVDECIINGAKLIDWAKRPSTPGSLRDGEWKIGYGMAAGMWNAGRLNASAGIKMTKDGTITVQTAMTDIGTGTGNVMLNVAHDVTGIAKDRIRIELGNSNLPPAPMQGGSLGQSSISSAVVAVGNLLKQKLAEYAAVQNPNYKNAVLADVILGPDGITLKNSNAEFISYSSIWENNKLDIVEVEASSGPGEERQKFAFNSSAAHFAIVRVHEKTGRIKVDRMVCVADGGKIVNSKAAENQVTGAVVGGIGMALMEQQSIDVLSGSVIANDLAGYHFPVNADAPIIEVSFINKPDFNLNPTGSKGLGEVGIIGVAPAIANAIFNATGKRLRDLPIMAEDIL